MNTKLNRSDYIILLVYYIISIIIQVYGYYLDKNELIEYLVDVPMNVILSLLIILAYLYWIIPSYAKKKKYAQFTVYGLLVLICFGGIRLVSGIWSEGEHVKFSFTFLIRTISIATQISGFPFAILLTKKFYESQTQIIEIEKQQKENELKLLRSQIDPHFLFNNLNTLDALIDSNPNKAKEYINRLSLIYRYLIKTKDMEVMELSDEIQQAENYMFLIKTRFENDYAFTIKNTVSLTNKYMPTGTLQAVLENVVKHNKADKNPIITEILIDDNQLTVTNTKNQQKSIQESFGTGITNLQARYKLLTDQKIKIINNSTEYKITLPIINVVDTL